MTDYTLVCWFLLGYALLLLAILLFVDAPYGKRDRDGWGPALPVRWSWFLLEVPSFAVPLWVLYRSERLPGWPGAVLIAAWLTHYFHRSFIYPMSLRPRQGASFKAVMLVLGAPMNALVGWMMATMVITEPHLQSVSWFYNPAFLLGAALFAGGFALTKRADATLRGLRVPGDSGYYIPQGGAYRLVSCPNYLGEILQWTGFALASWSLAGVAFALYTAANLLPRAIASHNWYREQFVDYPARRRALIPFLL